METTFVMPLKSARRQHSRIAGGKGANLGELSTRFIVPDGIIVTSGSFREFAKHNKIEALIEELEKTQKGETAAILRGKIMSSEMPKHIRDKINSRLGRLNKDFVAVRSSAVFEDSAQASWAGQLETYTNVHKGNAIEHVKKCWASLFSDRAIDYYSAQKNKSGLEMAVVIQEMLNPQTSGICFTANPVTNNKNEIIIEAGFGLGESIVSGRVTPDIYVVNKTNLKISKIEVSEQTKMHVFSNGKTVEADIPYEKRTVQKLEEEKMLELAKIAVEIERHYNSPQDIEWACQDGKLYFLQARPITTIV